MKEKGTDSFFLSHPGLHFLCALCVLCGKNKSVPFSCFVSLVIVSAGSIGQTDFKSGWLTINTKSQDLNYRVEVADNAHSKSIGLMFRSILPVDQGMLLLNEKPQRLNIWMKNTFLPLDIIYIDAQGYIVKIIENAPPGSTALMPSGGKVKAVLELNAGQVHKHEIAVGDRVTYRVH